MNTPELPPPDLKDVDYELWGQNVKLDCWFAAKMRAYGDARAAAAVLAERERCAKLCERELTGLMPAHAAFNALSRCVDAIRAEPKEQRDRLRAAQAEAVMPLIGPLLDEWECRLQICREELPELDRQLRRINRAMEDAEPKKEQQP